MSEDRGTLARLLGDPVRVRRPAGIAGFAMAIISGVSYLGIGDGWPALLYGLTWLALPVVAAAQGYAAAFFIQHGRGARRAALEAILGLLGAIACCAVLALLEPGESRETQLVVVGVAAGLYLAVLRGLGAGIALAVGRGLDYAGRRIQALDDEGW